MSEFKKIISTLKNDVSELNSLIDFNKLKIEIDELEEFEIDEEQEQSNDDNDKFIKCTINFANKKARDLLFNSKFIELENNKNIYKFHWNVDIESIPII